MSEAEFLPAEAPTPDRLYKEAIQTYGKALERVARAYEADPETRRDLVQDIHVALWRSFSGFNGRCSLRTWVYRVARNVAVTHMNQRRRTRSVVMVGLEELDSLADKSVEVSQAGRHLVLERLQELIYRLRPLDRQVMLLYLEGLDAVSIAEITGITAQNVATKIHRTKRILARRFQEGEQDEE